MATFSTTDEHVSRPEELQAPPAQPEERMSDEPAPDAKSVSARVRDELWQPRYAVIAGIAGLLIILQVWILF